MIEGIMFIAFVLAYAMSGYMCISKALNADKEDEGKK